MSQVAASRRAGDNRGPDDLVKGFDTFADSEDLMDTLRKDLVFALRSLRRQPGFTAITLLTLALGIGANTAVFSVVNGVILRPLPYERPGELQFVSSQFPGLGFDQFWISLPEFLEYRDTNQTFSSIGAYQTGAVNLDSAPPSRVVQAIVTPELLPTLGVQPIAGRLFTAADSVPGAEPTLVLSWELWQRAFGGKADSLGQTVLLNNVTTRVVGIMPRGFDVHDQKVELYQPLTIDPATLPTRRGNHNLYLIGRLKPGVSAVQARADLDVILGQWRTRVPTGHVPSLTGHRFRIDPLKEDMIGSVRLALLILQGAVAFVLLIACANLANLLIARADTRAREYAVRTALGASRARLLRQLVTEGLLLATTAAVLGMGLAWGGLRLLLSVSPDAIPRTAEIGLDVPVLVFTMSVTAITGLIFGLVPLLHLGRGIGQSLKDSGNRSATGSARAGLRSALVVAEVALAVLLVVGAGLLVRSFLNLTRVDMGFQKESLHTFGVVLPPAQYTPPQRVAFFDRLTGEIQKIAGARSVAAASGLPPLRNVNANDTDFEHLANNRAQGDGPNENVDFWQYVTVNYLATMNIPVLEGRGFERADIEGAPVVLINETLARKFFTDRNPIGQRVKPGFNPSQPWFTVVGVVKDVKQAGVSAATGTELYLLYEQLPRILNNAPTQMNLVVRSELPLEQMAGGFRQAVATADASLPIVRMRTMTDVIDAAIARPRFLTVLLGMLAGLALALAAVGTYGVLSYLVSERKQEIGIRMALGATPREILGLVLRRGLALAGLGLGIGLAGSIALTRLMASMLFNVSPLDPATLVVVATVVAAVALIACATPAWRATQVNPINVIR